MYGRVGEFCFMSISLLNIVTGIFRDKYCVMAALIKLGLATHSQDASW